MSSKSTTIADSLKSRMKDLNLKNQDIADNTGVSKYMVSKAINGHLVKVDSGSLLKIFNFLGLEFTNNEGVALKSLQKDVEPENCTVIMDALKSVWDGSQESAVAIAQLLHTAHWMSKVR
ncbi:hypothetical protein [Idiomarina sp.]|uniref:hypothetical protein n=1 Tax=Idiomarina sp. TaxID=1874361 RepID=UPI003A91E0E8